MQKTITKQDVELLNFTYQNAEMGITGINQLRVSVKNDEFLNVLNKQYEQYECFIREVRDQMTQIGEQPKNINFAAKAGSYISNVLNTSVDDTVSHLADMMIQGTVMGITKLLQKLNAYTEASNDVRNIAVRLVKCEEENVSELKRYL